MSSCWRRERRYVDDVHHGNEGGTASVDAADAGTAAGARKRFQRQRGAVAKRLTLDMAVFAKARTCCPCRQINARGVVHCTWRSAIRLDRRDLGVPFSTALLTPLPFSAEPCLRRAVPALREIR